MPKPSNEPKVAVRRLASSQPPNATLLAAFVAILGCVLPHTAMAGNGLNFIGFGLESNAMAGADLAVARDAFALNTNPAGLAQLSGLRVDLHGGVAWELGIEHDDRFSGRQDIRNDVVPVGNIGVARRFSHYPVTLGTALTASGGGGYDYGRIATPSGGQDRLSSLFGIVRGSIGGAVKLHNRLAVGGGLGLSYSRLDQKVFPDTSVVSPMDPNRTFFGTEINNAQAFGEGFRVGALWEIGERVKLGVTYGSKIDLPVEDGRLTANLSALGLSKVKYRDLKIRGLAQAREVGIGIACKVTSRLLIATDVTWLDWSDALGTVTVRADEPDDPRAPSILRATSTLRWRDQYVVAIGTAYQPTEALTLWAGYNYGRNPIPNDHLSPLLVNIAEHHIVGGTAWRLKEGVEMGLAIEYQLPNEVNYENPELPFGSDVRARHSYAALNLGLSLEF